MYFQFLAVIIFLNQNCKRKMKLEYIQISNIFLFWIKFDYLFLLHISILIRTFTLHGSSQRDVFQDRIEGYYPILYMYLLYPRLCLLHKVYLIYSSTCDCFQIVFNLHWKITLLFLKIYLLYCFFMQIYFFLFCN